jgi:hypothetical protein
MRKMIFSFVHRSTMFLTCSAVIWTGEAVSFLLRPAGAGGWVTTAAMLKVLSSFDAAVCSIVRQLAATSGVPISKG